MADNGRGVINPAMLTARNRPNELRRHLRGALNSGVTREEVQEVPRHMTVDCGTPAALECFRIAAEAPREAGAKKS